MNRPSLGETAGAARILARLHVQNAEEYVATVARTSGVLSVEYAWAVAVLSREQAALLATYTTDGIAAVSGYGERP